MEILWLQILPMEIYFMKIGILQWFSYKKVCCSTILKNKTNCITNSQRLVK